MRGEEMVATRLSPMVNSWLPQAAVHWGNKKPTLDKDISTFGATCQEVSRGSQGFVKVEVHQVISFQALEQLMERGTRWTHPSIPTPR